VFTAFIFSSHKTFIEKQACSTNIGQPKWNTQPRVFNDLKQTNTCYKGLKTLPEGSTCPARQSVNKILAPPCQLCAKGSHNWNKTKRPQNFSQFWSHAMESLKVGTHL